MAVPVEDLNDKAIDVRILSRYFHRPRATANSDIIVYVGDVDVRLITKIQPIRGEIPSCWSRGRANSSEYHRIENQTWLKCFQSRNDKLSCTNGLIL